MLGGKGSGPSRLNGWIAIIGLAVGTLAMILSVSVMNGFEKRVIEKIVGFEGDLRLNGITQNNKDELIEFLSENQHIEHWLAFQERRGVILGRQDNLRMVTFKAVNIEKVIPFYDIDLKEGKTQAAVPEIYVGEMIARRLNINLGESVRILSPIDHGGGIGLPRQIQCVVSGIFRVQVLDIDDQMVYIPSEIGHRLFLRKFGPDGIDIRLKKGASPKTVKHMIKQEFPEITVDTWGELHSDLFSAMRLEKIGAIAVLSLIILVASFNLVSTLVLVTAQKIREFGILQTIGANRFQVKSIIIAQGYLIGGFGSFTGVILGISFVFIQNTFGIIPLPEDIYFTRKLPMDLFIGDLLVILLIAFGMVTFASFTAAKRALMFDPKEAVYMEK